MASTYQTTKHLNISKMYLTPVIIMAEIAVTSMSSKGQVVIPVDLRSGFIEGQKFIIIRSGKSFVLKSVNEFDKQLEEDLDFANRTEAALKRCEKGNCKTQTKEEFLKELETW
ncbi:MAG: AbrB/MazE/SpoVT family DNA-binding domain-containing protein [Candidatus Woesearchaeota archaeon]|nr:AbrB/MazE/SpoVT family DNA-binding domain-containing protein [Candidatus Woesearchaeota archaeon]